MYCKNCGSPLTDSQDVCLKCGVNKGSGKSFCSNCGSSVMPSANYCLNCGSKIASENTDKDYDRMMLGMIALLFGGWGVHNFILGENKKAIFKIIMTFCFGIGIILGIIDAVRLFSGKYELNIDKLM